MQVKWGFWLVVAVAVSLSQGLPPSECEAQDLSAASRCSQACEHASYSCSARCDRRCGNDDMACYSARNRCFESCGDTARACYANCGYRPPSTNGAPAH